MMFDTHKTRMIALQCGEETITIRYVVSIEYWNVTDRIIDISKSHVIVSSRDKNSYSKLNVCKTCVSPHYYSSAVFTFIFTMADEQ